ncbi:DUF6031 family protein [Phenylobacterium sp.]|uniref:DUF6031 family protein n=1 Tax=Phenylobacterium sp. TaxID=1871053 RepID=UPI003BAC8699
MMLRPEILTAPDRANSEGRRNVEDYFGRWNIDRAGLEAQVLRGFPGNAAAYYVSTIPRGLGGSTSDIDLLLVTDDPSSQEISMSRMLFFADRRVGVKVLLRRQIDASFDAVEDEIAAWGRGEGYPAGRLPIKWMDLERLVNGARFDGDPEYRGRISTLGRWATLVFFAAVVEQTFLQGLAVRAGFAAAARAYAQAAVAAAMDCVMASCGHFQSNTKWTLERWARFDREGLPAVVRRLAEQVDETRRLIESPAAAAVGQGLSQLRDDLERQLLAAVAGGRPHLAVNADVAVNDFLPGALVLQTHHRAAVVDRQAYERLLAAGGETASPAAAAMALALLEGGFLRLGHSAQGAAPVIPPSPPETEPKARILLADSLICLIDFYWHALSYLQNALEDVAGADGRLAYLSALRWRLVAALQAMEDALLGQDTAVGPVHRAAHALQRGLPVFGLSSTDLRVRLKLDEGGLRAGDLARAMLDLGDEVLGRLPGQLPAALGRTGQREIIRAMQMWSRAAAFRGDDIGFLAARLQEI